MRHYKSEDDSILRITPTGRTVEIRMRPGHAVIGEEGEHWYEGKVHVATEEFAEVLIRRQKAVEVDPERPVAKRLAALYQGHRPAGDGSP